MQIYIHIYDMMQIQISVTILRSICSTQEVTVDAM
jgi:hypothetical protein